MGQRGGSAEMHYDVCHEDILDSAPRVDPAAVDTVLEMVGAKERAPKAGYSITPSSIGWRSDGFIDKLYKGAKP